MGSIFRHRSLRDGLGTDVRTPAPSRLALTGRPGTHPERGWVFTVIVLSVGLFTTGFSAPIEDLRQEIRMLKMEQATITQHEESLMARQEELSRAIKQLKSAPRGQSIPFGPRKLETALKQLRAVLDERESLQRRRTDLGVRIDDAHTRLRTAVRDEILHIISRNLDRTDADDRTEIRALLTLYPPSPILPSLPPASEPAAIVVPNNLEALGEQTLLLRDQRERQDVILRRAETIHDLLSEELTLYRTLAEHDLGFETQWQSLDRQVSDARTLVEALNERRNRMDDALRQLDILMSQPVTAR